MNDRNRNLLWRVIAAVVLAPPLVLAIVAPYSWIVGVIVHLAVAVALYEFFQMTLAGEALWQRVLGVTYGVIVSVSLMWLPLSFLALMLGGMIILTTINLVYHRTPRSGTQTVAMQIFGALYVAVPITTLGLMKTLPDGSDWILLALSVTWLGDTGAYFVGRFMGRQPLYSAISPAKTVEGAFGALGSCFIAALIAHFWYMPQLNWVDASLIAIQAGALGLVGDLAESMFKRAFDTKDSGNIIPGHAGILDRIDGLLFIGPYIYLYAKHIVIG